MHINTATMKNIILISIICLLLVFPAFGQTTQNLYIGDGVSRLFLQSAVAPSFAKFDAKYLNSDWALGNLQTIDAKMLTNVAFMYNVTKDKFEMRADVNPKIVERIIYDGKVFIYSTYTLEGYERAGYFEQLSEGTTVLLLKYSVNTVSGKKGAFGYDAYQNIDKDFYIKIDDRPAVYVKKKKSDIINVLSDHKEQVQKFIKHNKLNLSKKKDIIELLQYYSYISSDT